jgi:plastocyanin
MRTVPQGSSYAPSTRQSFSGTFRRVTHHLRAAALVTMVTLLFVSACGSSSTTTPPATISTSVTPTSDITVTIQNFAFNPARFTVSPGATITVVNDDEVIHTLTADNRGFNSGDVTNGVPVTFQAPMQPGIYPFHDYLHGYMLGVLTVS